VSEPSAPAADETALERRTSPVELLWDLVFVFAITQVTTLLAHRPTWGRFGEGMLALALVWWAWSAFVWAANAHEADSKTLRTYLLVGTVLIFVVGLALPQAFGRQAVLFAIAYALVRMLHLALYAEASRRGSAARSAITGFGVTVTAGMVLLIAGALLLHGWHRALLWTAAVTIDYVGPAWLTRDRLRGLQRVEVAHLAERYGTFVIICLGESVLAIGVGVGTAQRPLTAELVLGATLPLLIAIAMWWTYFDRFAERAAARLREHDDPVLAASDGYSYIHLVIIAGVIIFAAGVKLVVDNPVGAPMPDPGRLAMCGGVAVYLIGLAMFRLRMFGELGYGRVFVAALLLALYAVGGGFPAWTIGAGIAALIWVLSAAESVQSARADSVADAAVADAAVAESGAGV
jgi:low temperature requirement protein LtrA